MASKLGETSDIKRVCAIDGVEYNLVFTAEGILFTRKGDKHKGEKPTIKLVWRDALEIGAERQHERGELKFRDKEFKDAYTFLGVD
jgi:hypothetical protein